MRYLQNTPFSVQIGNKDSQDKYRTNWERTFGKQQPPVPTPKPPKVRTHEAVANN